MTITIHEELVQGTEEWFQARCGLLTASEIKNIITPAKLQFANNDTSRNHLYDLLAQRITGYVEPSYQGDAMMRGKFDEEEACIIYNEKFAPLQRVGFITNDSFGFTLGFSPDALVSSDGFIEVKSRAQKFHIATIIADEMPGEFMIQVQTGLLVSGRKWCDFISYCGGMPMFVKRILPDPDIQQAIIEAAAVFEDNLQMELQKYNDALNVAGARFVPTERKDYSGEIYQGSEEENGTS